MRLKDRSLPRGAVQVLPTMLAYTISAVWHGFDEGFFLFFVFVAIFDIFCRIAASTKLAELVESVVPSVILRVLIAIFVSIGANYFVLAFTLLKFEKIRLVYEALGYCGHYMLLLGIPLAMLLPKRKSKRTSTVNDKKQLKTE